MNIFHQLRWKLTLSYTLVTVCAFLVITLILGGLLFSKILLPYNAITPEGLIQNLLDNPNPLWRHLISQPPVAQELLSYVLHDPEVNFFGKPFFQVGSAKFTINTTSAARVFLISADGILLGASDLSFPPTSPVGKPFPVEKVPGLQAIYAAALAGEIDPKLLYFSQGEVNTMWGPANRITLGIPIFDQENGTQGRVLGVMAAVVDPFPYQSTIPRNLLVLAGRSLLFFLFGAGIMGAIFGSISANGLTRRFERLSSATEIWSEGDFSTQIEDRSGDELARLAGRLNAMAGQLQSLLRRRQEMAISEERNRLARDLHDSAKQQALAASFELGTALTLYENHPQDAKKHLLEADALVDSVRKELTNLVDELRPKSTDNLDLNELLKEHGTEWSRRSGIKFKINVEGSEHLNITKQETLFRIAQEALANIARHSSASRAVINLKYRPKTVQLEIKDNGCGFDLKTQHGGLGLHSMQERTEALGGSLTIESEPGKGTRIKVVLSREDEEEGDHA
jgi:signal transduction histidine kinase